MPVVMPVSKPTLAFRLADLARVSRTLLLRLLSPAESALRQVGGRGHLPPLWLRRHVGPVGRFESAAREMTATLDRLGLIRPGDLVVDLGCGCGAMAPALGERVGEAGRYVGIDVHEPAIRWCRRHWASDGRFRFELAAAECRVPVADGAAGFVLAKSLFTHLLEPKTRAYLTEIRRLLAPGRRALVTAFLFAGGEVEPPAFPHPRRAAAGAAVRWRLAVRPQAAVAYDRARFAELIAAAGLSTTTFVPGFWPGTDRPPRGQDVLVVERPAEV